jgi:hypothetical protein
MAARCSRDPSRELHVLVTAAHKRAGHKWQRRRADLVTLQRIENSETRVPRQRAQPSSDLIHKHEPAVLVIARHNRLPKLLLLPTTTCFVRLRGIRNQANNMQIQKLLFCGALGHGFRHVLHGRIQLLKSHTLDYMSTDSLSTARLVAANHVLRKINTEISPKLHHGGEVADNSSNGLVAVAVVDANLKCEVLSLCAGSIKSIPVPTFAPLTGSIQTIFLNSIISSLRRMLCLH